MALGIALSRDPFRALSTRLSIRFALLVLVLVLGSGGVVYAYVRHALISASSAVEDLAVLSLLESVQVQGGSLSLNAAEFEEELAEVNETLGVVHVQLWNRQGELLAKDPNSQTHLPRSGPAQELQQVAGQWLLLRRVDVQGQGLILVGRRADDLQMELKTLRRGLLLMLPLIVAGALAAGWIMAGQSVRPVRRAFEQQRVFMADASHELRTPLAIIRTQAEVALDAGASPVLSVIVKRAQQLGRLVDDLLFLSRADASVLVPRRTDFSLMELVEEVVEGMAPLAAQQGAMLELVAEGGALPVSADPDQMGRLLTIFIDNAARHGGKGTVTVTVRQEGKIVSLRVQDRGLGMPQAFLSRAWDRFVRGDAARSGEGSGLGLPIARAITEAHEGTVTLESQVGQGTVVTVLLPIGVSSPS